MNWMSLLAAAGAGALAAAIAAFILSRTGNKILALLVFLLVMIPLRDAADDYLRPLYLDREVRNVETELLKTPTFKALKDYDPATYQGIMADMRNGIDKKVPVPQITLAVRGHILKVVKRRIPTAPDAPLMQYTRVMVQELGLLAQKDPALCYDFMMGNTTAISQHLTKEVTDADLAALADVIRGSATNPQQPPSQAAVQGDLQLVFRQLYERHGSDIEILDRLQAPGIDKAKACALVTELYEGVLLLPPARSGDTLRFMFAQQG